MSDKKVLYLSIICVLMILLGFTVYLHAVIRLAQFSVAVPSISWPFWFRFSLPFFGLR